MWIWEKEMLRWGAGGGGHPWVVGVVSVCVEGVEVVMVLELVVGGDHVSSMGDLW